MPSCPTQAPRGQTCPQCGEQHSQPKSRIGSTVILLGFVVLIAGLGYYAWAHRDDGYGYDPYKWR